MGMAMARTKSVSAGTTLRNCSVTSEAFVVNEHTASAIRAIADAAAANARALEACANRLAGPVDSRVGFQISNAG